MSPEPGEPRFSLEAEPSAERGENVRIVLKFLRHGERTKTGELTEYGRDVTRQRAQESVIGPDDYDAVKAIGSPAGPQSAGGMERSLETAHIYAHEIAGDEAFNTRRNAILNYETLKNPSPYDHVEIYNANLPPNFDSLSDAEKAAAAKKAQTVVVNHLISLKSAEAQAFKREVAGAFAYVIDHYQRVATRLKSGSQVLLPAGTHGGLMEHLLQQALVRRDEQGEMEVGFENIEEIGGEFDPSEAFNVAVTTDERGDFGPLEVTFDNPERPQFHEMYLDPDRLRELRDYYVELHKPKRK